MDVLTEDPSFSSGFGSDIGIDSDSVTLEDFDLDKLEKYITNDVCLPEEAIPAIAYNHPTHSNGFRINNIHLQGLGSRLGPGLGSQQTTQSLPQPVASSGTMYSCSQQQQQHQPAHTISSVNTTMPYLDKHPMMHTLPDSPPDSEPPYSPPDGHHPNSHMNGHTNGHHSNLQNTHQDNSKFLTSTPSTTMHSHLYPPHHRPPGMSQPKPLVTMPGYHENPILNLPPTPHQPQMPPANLPHHMPPTVGGNLNAQILSNPGNLSPQSKKRKHMESPPSGMPGTIFNGRNGLVPTIKQEPAGGYSNSSYLPDCDDEYSNYDPDSNNGYDNGVYPTIKWQSYQPNKWAILTDANLKDLPAPQFRVDADKGFNFSVSDESFVCQKKNHFQITSHIGVSGDPKYVRTPEGVKKIDRYCLHFFGVKLESQNQMIKIEQSQSDRSKKPYVPARVDVYPDQVSKMTVGRLHFSETTSNNMRKKGRPNPDQRYFILIVSLNAHSGDTSYMVAANQSEKIIVRASNPGQFDSDVDGSHWQKGQTPDSVYHVGRVGINTDHPDEALAIHGNIKVAGQILHTSDKRAKEIIREVPSKEQLKKVAGMKIYDYKYDEDYANHVGLPEGRRTDTGVIAQEVKEVLPDAVIETGDLKFENGKEINNLLVVNKDRIFMENVGAVKELCKLTDNLEVRIDELEKMNSKLSKLKRFDSLKSTVSSKSTCSNNTISSVARKPHKPSHHKSRHPSQPTPPTSSSWCSNRFIQITIIILICIMAFCLIAITTLYILERQKDEAHTVINNHYNGPTHGGSNSSLSTPKPDPHVGGPTARPNISSTTKGLTSIVVSSTLVPVTPVTIPAICEPSQCEVQCCDTFSDGGDGDIVSRFRDDIRLRKKEYENHASNPSYSIATQSPMDRQMPTDKVVVILNPNREILEPQKDPQSLSGGPYRYRRSKKSKRSMSDTNRNAEFNARITIHELNFTVPEMNKERDYSYHNNFTYQLPYSQYTDLDPYTLAFSVEENHEVHLCNYNTEQSCDQGAELPQNFTETATQWLIPFGRYKSSVFRFRVTRSNNAAACSQAGELSDGQFTDYNLIFARKCLD